jgi:hypothetical protein
MIKPIIQPTQFPYPILIPQLLYPFIIIFIFK